MVESMTLSAELAARIVAMEYDALPREAVRWAKIALRDTVGVTLAGSREEAVRILMEVPGIGDGAGPSLVIGTNRRTTPLDAALLNGTSAHALDFDDCNDTLGGHPSAPILPALIALAELRGAGGAELLLAFIAGFETETRIARGVNFHHYDKGWHPTATLGVFGSAAACARLLGMSAERTATALSLAVSLASGVKSNFGTMTKPLHVGHCARNGLLAALLARDGFTAAPDAFEHKQGFLRVFNGPGHFDTDRILADWADPLDILDPGVAIKRYPCCGSAHSAIDAMLELVREHGLGPENVLSIEAMPHPRRLTHTDRPDPESPMAAKFSLQYCLARALADGEVVLAHFEGEGFRDPRIREIMGRIRALPHPAMAMDATEHFGAEIRVTKSDGQVVSRMVDRPRGSGPADPIPAAELDRKFLDCATRALTPERAKALAAMIEDFEALTHVRAFTACCEPDGAVRQGQAAE